MKKKLIINKKTYAQVKEEGLREDLTLVASELIGFSLGLARDSQKNAVNSLESQARKMGATHLFGFRLERFAPQEGRGLRYRPLGRYEARAAAYKK